MRRLLVYIEELSDTTDSCEYKHTLGFGAYLWISRNRITSVTNDPLRVGGGACPHNVPPRDRITGEKGHSDSGGRLGAQIIIFHLKSNGETSHTGKDLSNGTFRSPICCI